MSISEIVSHKTNANRTNSQWLKVEIKTNSQPIERKQNIVEKIHE